MSERKSERNRQTENERKIKRKEVHQQKVYANGMY